MSSGYMILSPRHWFGAMILAILLAGCSPSTPVLEDLPPAIAPSPTSPLVLTVEIPPTTEPSPTGEPLPTPKPSSTIELSPTAAPSPAPLVTFSSQRHAYSIEYPANWLVTERPGEWKSGDLLFQNSAGVDTFSAPGIADFFVIGEQPVPEGMSLEQWMNIHIEVRKKIFGDVCGEPQTAEASFGGEAAITQIYHCADGYFEIFMYTLHAGKGYLAFWVSGPGNEVADEETFNQFIKGLAFTP